MTKWKLTQIRQVQQKPIYTKGRQTIGELKDKLGNNDRKCAILAKMRIELKAH